MSVYSFSFSANQAGKRVAVVDSNGVPVASGTLGPADAVSGPVVFSATLNAGFYKAQAFNANGTLSAEAPSVLDTTGTVPVPFAAGGGGSSTDRGTLYLKASGTGLSLATSHVAAGDGVLMGYVLDTAKSSTVPSWVTQVDGTFVLDQIATYRAGIAVKATAHYPSGAPALCYIDTYENAVNGVNVGQASDGSDDAPAYPVDVTTDIPFFCKEMTVSTIASHSYPITLTGFTIDNDGDQAADATLDIEARLSITQVGSGDRYVAGDLS